jgi:hypothetical protein
MCYSCPIPRANACKKILTIKQTNVQVSEDSDVDFVPFDTHAISVSGWKGRVEATVTTYFLKWDTILELDVGC